MPGVEHPAVHRAVALVNLPVTNRPQDGLHRAGDREHIVGQFRNRQCGTHPLVEAYWGQTPIGTWESACIAGGIENTMVNRRPVTSAGRI